MAAHFSSCGRANLRGPLFPPPPRSSRRRLRCSANGGGDSYLDMWKKAMDRERRYLEFRTIADRRAQSRPDENSEPSSPSSSLEAKTERFNQLLQVPTEERDRIQRLQVIHRAAAAIAAARALLEESPPPARKLSPAAVSAHSVSSEGAFDRPGQRKTNSIAVPGNHQGSQLGDFWIRQSTAPGQGTPGSDFWSWSPPSESKTKEEDNSPNLMPAAKLDSLLYASSQVMEKERSEEEFAIPLESTLFEDKHNPLLPPLQSLLEIDKMEMHVIPDESKTVEENKLEVLFQRYAAQAAETLKKCDEESTYGLNSDGSKWWRETGMEQKPNGVVYKWTLTRGVSADEAVEWEDKFWEAADQFDYKELGSEKSGRDASGNVWREYWKESMWQDLRSGLLHIEKTADKWGKNGKGNEWKEKWWEHYDASGKAEKWAHKWCCIDPKTPLEVGHAHVWHERWGEKYDGNGGSMKYTDKWAARSEGYWWSKWGDKWDEHFDSNGHGVKQGETWWQGKHGERWNRTWGEQHNGTGWIHKYGKSSSGEHWDTHVQQETWYEKHPHFGFEHCFQNSVQLRAVHKPVDTL